MAKNEVSDFLDDVDDDAELDGMDNEEQESKVSNQYEARRRIEELLEQKRLRQILNDFEDYLEA